MRARSISRVNFFLMLAGLGIAGGAGYVGARGDRTGVVDHDLERGPHGYVRCATPPVDDHTAAIVERWLAEHRRDRGMGEPSAATGVVVPIAFHVIHAGEHGKLSNSDMQIQVDVLNDAYASAGVTFTLASVDYTDNPAWFSLSVGTYEEYEMKSTLNLDSYQYLNFYTANLEDGLLGWATFPWYLDQDPTMDGVVILFETFPGGSADPYNEGDTAVHEIGHWSGLYHTFQNGCRPPGDSVSDTPAERTASYGCPVGQDSCLAQQGTDPVQNFMDYSDDACMTGFSRAQGTRMLDMFSRFRTELVE